MTLGANSLDQLARVRRLLQRFAVPDPGVRLITLDAEAHASALDPHLAVLDPAPFGGLGNVEAAEVSTAEAGTSERRASRATQTPGDAARRERRQEMLKPSRLAQSTSKPLAADASRPLSTQQLPSISPPASSNRPGVEASTQNKLRISGDAPDSATPPGKNTSAPKLVKQADPHERKVVSFSLAGPGKEKSAASEEKVELGTLVGRVLQKRREASNSATRKRGSHDDALEPSASPKRARLHGATVTQRPLPASVVMPVAPGSSSAPRNNALVVTQRTVRSSLTELVNTPNPVNKRDATESGAIPAAAAPTFFFNALESRKEEETEATLTDRIDQVLREQARRQGVDLT